MKACLKAMTALAALLPAAAFAQGLDELPPDVGAVAADFVAECERYGGTADYTPWDYVRLLPGPAGDVFAVDTAQLRCPGGDIGDPQGRVGCTDGACYLVIMTPRGNGYGVDFNDAVTRWSANGDTITLDTANGRQRFRIGPAGLEKDG